MKASVLNKIGIVLIVIALLNCESKDPEFVNVELPTCVNPTSDTSLARILIVGEWEWMYTYTLVKGEGSPKVDLPKSKGTRKLIFRADKSLQVIEQEKKPLNQIYSIEAQMDDPNLYIYIQSLPAERPKISILRMCGDSLVIDNTYNDSGGKELYRRTQ